MTTTCIIHPNVRFGANHRIDDFVIIGAPPREALPGEMITLDDCSIGTHSNIEHHVKIGNRVRIHSHVFIPEYSVLEDDAWVGPGAVFTNDLYPPSRTVDALKGPHLMPGARVGANATLLPCVIIGRNALVGAGAVVVGDVPDGKVVVGNPARIIKDISELTAYSAERIAGQGG